MPRWPLLLLTLSLTLPGCKAPQETPASQPTTQIADSQTVDPQTQPATTQASTQPSTVPSIGRINERKILALKLGMTFENVASTLDTPLLGDSGCFMVMNVESDAHYMLFFGEAPGRNDLVLLAILWNPQVQYVPDYIVVSPATKSGITLEDTFALVGKNAFDIPPAPATQPATTQPAQPPQTPGT
jgi:hypothetical protein